MVISVHVTIFILLAAASSVSCQCDNSRVEVCISELKSMQSANASPFLALNETQLNKICSVQREAVSCVHDYLNECLPKEQKIPVLEHLSAVLEIGEDLCDPQSEKRKIYLKHPDCYAKMSSNFKICEQRFEDWTNSYAKNKKFDEEFRRLLCCEFDKSQTCMKTAVKKTCPGEAHDFFHKAVDKATKNFYKFMKCDEQGYTVADSSGVLGLCPLPGFLLSLLLLKAFLDKREK